MIAEAIWAAVALLLLIQIVRHWKVVRVLPQSIADEAVAIWRKISALFR